ncbi:hypothetical protein [Sphingobium sp. TKS]|uniref:hypothetical protein n=1 Tax=Sphingobium sp. TKS TaxID=1315974 RepID=UPI0007704F8E|nr:MULTISPECIES: hypothetical protein [Sphingomonadaceae]AMK24152.1 hypothetical protein K426_16100 [Sphingobium sp. TKS]
MLTGLTIFSTTRADARRPDLLDADGNMIDPTQLMLISFQNIKDSNSGFEVDPNSLAAVFGPGYRFRHIRIEETYGPPTFGAMDKFVKPK